MYSTHLELAPSLSAEVEEGNTEYKFKLTGVTHETLIHRTTQLNWRLNEGAGEAIYKVGVEDNGNPFGISEEDMTESIANLEKMAEVVGCNMTVLRLLRGKQASSLIAEVMMRRSHRQSVNPEQVILLLILLYFIYFSPLLLLLLI